VLTSKKFKNQAVRGPITYVTQTQAVSAALTSATTITAVCPFGTHPTGGGAKGQDPNADFIFDQYITTQGYAARVFSGGPATGSHTFTVIAACATVKTIAGTPPAS
jgi:hypothetical protein